MRGERKESPDRLPRTERGRETLERILGSAEEVFRERGYEAASVSAICRRTGLAQGTFYLYFASKEDVYVRLVEGLQNRIVARLRASIADESNPRARLLGAYGALLDFISENPTLFQVFREAEFVRPEIPMRLYATVCGELAQAVEEGIREGEFRPVDPDIVAYAVLGAVFFLSLRYVVWGDGEVPACARHAGSELIFHGIDGCPSNALPVLPGRGPTSGQKANPEEAEGGEGGEVTRRTLLRAAERAFGQAGFHRTTVATITYLAGVGQGTFYLHFPSKVAVFNELVQEIGRGFRRQQSVAVAGCADRRSAEEVGLRSFLDWVREHPGAYRILREAEFVDEGVGKGYYTRLAEGYRRGLAAAMERGEIRRCNAESLTYVLLGIAHLSGQRWALWEEASRRAEDVLPSLVDFILRGVGGAKGLPR